MSSGKRIAKRSILGTRVVAPGIDGRFYPAVIQSAKTYDPTYCASENRYLVKFDNSRKVSEFGERELIGPGFAGVSAIGTLLTGQRVYLTHVGREVEATVLQHDVKADIVSVNLSSGEQLTVRTEEIRLLESRKSSRLMVRQTSNQDFSKLGEFNSLVHERRRYTERRRLNSEISSNSDSSDIFSSRKRRGSETVSEEGSSSEECSRKGSRLMVEERGLKGGLHRRFEAVREEAGRRGPKGELKEGRCSSPIMSECTAAMVLMDLYGSPVSRTSHFSGHSDSSSGQMSPSSSGVSSLGSSWNSPSLTTPPFPLPTPSPPSTDTPTTFPSPSPSEEEEDSPVSALLQLSGDLIRAQAAEEEKATDSDEGIVSDNSFESEDNHKRKKTEGVRTIFQCTWPSCRHQEVECHAIEQHVRVLHLNLPPCPPGSTAEDDDHEEEFYYTEFEVPEVADEDIPSDCLVVEEGEELPLQLERETSSSMSEASSFISSHAPSSVLMSPSPPAAAVVSTSLSNLPPILADHSDMARPPHENPEYTANRSGCATILSTSSPTYATIISPSNSLGLPIAIPITTFTIAGGSVPGKYIRLSPKPCLAASPKSPIRRPRGDAKKCRKVYGMEQRELWCTQCKWKKACTRFGEALMQTAN